MEQTTDNSLAQRLKNFFGDDLKSKLHYFIFDTSQILKQKNDQASKYSQRLGVYWKKWLGIGAGIAGILMLLDPNKMLFWQLPLVLMVIFLAPWFSDLFFALKTATTEPPGKRFIGQTATLDTPIVDGKGSVRLNNQTWNISGTDCPAGTSVKITGVNGRTLHTTPLPSKQ